MTNQSRMLLLAAALGTTPGFEGPPDMFARAIPREPGPSARQQEVIREREERHDRLLAWKRMKRQKGEE